MKKTITILILTIISFKGYSQAYAGINVSSIGVGLSVGVEANNVAVEAFMSHPLRNAEAPGLCGIKVGYIYQFTDENSFNVSLHGGYAYSKSKIVSKNLEVTDNNKFPGLGEIQVGKDMHTGRLYVNFGYAGRVYYGIGLKCFL